MLRDTPLIIFNIWFAVITLTFDKSTILPMAIAQCLYWLIMGIRGKYK